MNWSGLSCDVCAPGYFGAQCNSECPGGAGNPCGGRGTCLDGLTGNGTCLCNSGLSGGDCSVGGCPAGAHRNGSSCMDCAVGKFKPVVGDNACQDW